mmetsp:Transcript_6539/g.14454  ORF Transcript_6539/g.14454 Transcript_6539/m.14454 type:complete len:288 (+) Transcript_6539:259-1122(+)
MQTQKMPSGMQKVLSGRQARQAVHRGRTQKQDRLPLGTALHRMRHLRQKVSLRGHQHHQPPQGSGKEHHPPLRTQQLQAPPSSHAATRPGVGISRDQRHRKIHRPQNPRGKDETQPRPVRLPPRLGGDPRPLPRLRPPELPHQNFGGRHQGHDQAAVRRSHPPRGAGIGGGHSQEEGREDRERGMGLFRLGAHDGGAEPRFGSRRGRAERGGVAAVCHCGRGGAGFGRVHVRRTEFVLGREAAADGGAHDPTGVGAHGIGGSAVRYGGGARSRRVGLFVGLRLRPLW